MNKTLIKIIPHYVLSNLIFSEACMNYEILQLLQLAFNGFVQQGRHKGLQFGGGGGLQLLERFDAGLVDFGGKGFEAGR